MAGFVVTDTDRGIRVDKNTGLPTEQNGVHYHFVSQSEFTQRIMDKKYLEWVWYGKGETACRKGTRLEVIRESSGLDVVVLRIDPQGASRVITNFREGLPQHANQILQNMTVVYLQAEESAIRERLANRDGTVDTATIEEDKRMKLALGIAAISWIHEVTNRQGQLSETVETVMALMDNPVHRVLPK